MERTVVDPVWGGKLTGKSGRNLAGVFVTRDESNSLMFPSSQGSASALLENDVTASVLRYRRNLGQGSTLGVRYTGREAEGYHNRVGGLDGFFRLSNTDEVTFQYLWSDTEYPDDVIQRASARAQRAECLARLGEIPAAIEAFRMNLRAEGEFSGVRTNAWLDFGWLMVQHVLADLYGEVTGVFDGRGKDPSALAFPIQRYRYHAVRALLANAAGRRG